jgi:hypothetical protein
VKYKKSRSPPVPRKTCQLSLYIHVFLNTIYIYIYIFEFFNMKNSLPQLALGGRGHFRLSGRYWQLGAGWKLSSAPSFLSLHSDSFQPAQFFLSQNEDRLFYRRGTLFITNFQRSINIIVGNEIGTLLVRYHEDWCTKNKRMIWIPTCGLF